MENLGIASVAAITVICLLIGQAVKASAVDSKWIPIICGVCGLILGIAAMYIMPDFPATDYITAAAIGNVLIAASIFLNAKKLGALFLPALALYFVLLTVLLAAILRRRELDRLHALVGDEQFYEWYPRQRRRDERRRARMKRALEKHDRKARRKEPKR